MPDTITTFTAVEKKHGSNDMGPYVISIFTDEEGKKFKTFKDDIAAKVEASMGQALSIEFDVQSRQWNGRTLVDNMITAVKNAGEMTSVAGDVAAVSPTAQKILAFRAAVDLLVALPEKFGEDPGFVEIAKVADAIYEWASQESLAEQEADPEPEPEPVTN